MKDGGAEIGLQQQVFGTATHPMDGEVHQLLNLTGDRPAQAAIPHHHARHLDTGKPGEIP